jgi:hypothetical protein
MTERPDLAAAEPLAAALVRLVRGGTLLGSGFVLPGGLVATCAHVVRGVDGVTAQFPLLGLDGCAAEVVERDDESDVAILRLLDPPEAVRDAPVRLDTDLFGHSFRVLGFTDAEPEGVWVKGKLAGHLGSGRVQMAVDPHHERIVAGFSGAPVWDEQLDGVVGMVVTRSGSNDATAHLVPVSRLGEWTESGRNPYLGLAPFRAEDTALYHGRDDKVDDLLERFAQQDMIAIAGPSGSGKSSLVRAGLLPRLARDGVAVVELGPDDSAESVPIANGGTVLFLDQFEEAVAADPEAARARLGHIIDRVAAQPVRAGRPAPLRVLLTLRSQSLDELITPETAKKLNQAVWLLEPMSRTKLREAIVRPAAEVGGLAFEAGLVDAILHDTPSGHGTLPLLSEVLKQLWDHRHGGWLTHAAYEDLGRVTGALSKHADAALAALRPDAAEKAKRLLMQLTRPDGEGGYIRRSARLDELAPELREVAHELADDRLLVIRDEQVTLVHQALIDHWAELRGWLAEDAEFLVWQAKLQQLQDAGGLLRGAPLAQAADWLRDRAEDLPSHQQQFIRRSAATQRRTQSRWRTVSVAVGVLALVSAVLTSVVLQRNGQLEDKLRENNATTLAQEANRALNGNPAEALQMALASWHEKPDNTDAYGALLAQRMYWRGAYRVLPPQVVGSVESLSSSSDGRVVVVKPSGPADKVTVWWDLQGPNPTSRDVPEDAGEEFALSPDGRMLAVSGPEPGLRLWDLTKPGDPVALDAQGAFGAPTFSPNGRFLTALPGEFTEPAPPGPVRVWDLETMRELPSGVRYDANGERIPMQQAYPSSDGRALVTTEPVPGDQSGSYEPVVRDLATGTALRTIPLAHGGDSALLDNGAHVAACNGDALTISDSFTGEVAAQYPNPRCSVMPDISGQYLLLDTDPNSAQVVEAVQWRTGTRFAFANPEVSNSWGSGNPLLVPAPGGGLSAISVRDHAVQVSSVPTTTNPTDREVISRGLSVRTPDGGRWITYAPAPDGTESGGEIAVLDSRGVVLDRTPVPRSPAGVAVDASGERAAVVFGPTLHIYRTAGLVLEREEQLPVPAGRDDDARHADRTASLATAPNGDILVSHMGILSSWNAQTGVRTAPPLVLDSPAEWDPLPGGPDFALRPGHPEQLVVQTGRALSVWDVRARKQLADFQLEGLSVADRPVVSPDGLVAATISGMGTSVALINLDELTELPSLNGKIDQIYGLSGKYLFANATLDFQVWNWQQPRLVTSVTLYDSDAQREVEGDELIPNRLPGHREPIPLDPDAWFRDLCRISDREFTPEEERLLPEGVSHEPPCR